MSATNELRRMLDERGIEWGNVRDDGSESDHLTEWKFEGIQSYAVATEWPGGLSLETHQHHLTPEQAIAATLGSKKAKAHPYGYEPDTGAFDVTRCECGCLNDISATYCNDCGGVIEVDVNAEKEIYKYSPRNSVFATKHDDGSLEFGGKRYVAATVGAGTCKVESMHGYTDAHTHTSWCVELSCHTLDAWEDSIPPSYCPICGRKVVDDG